MRWKPPRITPERILPRAETKVSPPRRWYKLSIEIVDVVKSVQDLRVNQPASQVPHFPVPFSKAVTIIAFD